jgi:heme A synthase
MDSLMRLREPAAWVALGALALNLVLAVVGMMAYPGPLANVALTLSVRAANPVPLVVLTILVSFCVLRERTPHARLLTMLSLLVGGLAVLLGLTLALVGLAADPTPVLGVLAALVVQVTSVIAVVLLIKLLQLQAVPRRLPAGIGLAPYPEPLPLPQPPDQRLQPTWQPDAAAGAVWRTAGEAAAGAPATGWGANTSAAWQPIPTQPDGPRPQARVPDGPATRSQGQSDLQPPVLDWWGRPQS